MRAWFDTKRHILLSILVGIAVVLAFGIFFLLQSRHLPPEAYLPASNVTAHFSRMPTSALQKFSRLYPLLSALPPASFPAVTVIRTDDGSEGLAVFTEYAIDPDQGDVRLGPYVVHTSSQEIAAILQKSQESEPGEALANSASFRAFAKHLGTIPWVYMETNELPMTKGLSEQIAKTLIGRSDRVAIAMPSQDQVSILFESGMSGPAIYGELRTPFASPTFALRSSNLALRWTTILQSLQGDSKDIVGAMLAGHAEEFFGPETSVSYDLFPLLERDTVLALMQKKEGVRLFSLEGEHDEVNDLRERLQSLLSRSRSLLPQSAIDEYIFDERFRMNVLRQNDESLNEQNYLINRWEVTALRTREVGRSFLAAQRGRRYILSNDPDAAELYLRNETNSFMEVSSILEGGWKLAEGIFPRSWIEKSEIESAIGQTLTEPTFFEMMASVLSSSQTESLYWSVVTDGRITAFTIQ